MLQCGRPEGKNTSTLPLAQNTIIIVRRLVILTHDLSADTKRASSRAINITTYTCPYCPPIGKSKTKRIWSHL